MKTLETNDTLDDVKMTYLYSIISVASIVLIACIPLFFNFPFRDNIYLSWEGAYRMYQGQMPFRDFGLPMGYGYWLFPTLSFHLFGPYLFSLVKIQVLINIISGISFWTIIRKIVSDKGLIAASVLLYVISFSFYNFWPWYNHTVIVFEFVGLAFLINAISDNETNKIWTIAKIGLSALFCFLSFFTKQDGGAFALLISGLILLYYTIVSRKWQPLVIFGICYLLFAAIFILPLLKYEFSYWFNYGQEPHYSRINLMDFMSTVFGESVFIKLYFLIIVLIVVSKSRDGFNWVKDKKFTIHLLLTLGILFQATILQVTSYVPVDGNIYYHSFMMLFILSNLNLGITYSRFRNFGLLMVLIVLWWSGLYWKYAVRLLPKLTERSDNEKNVVSQSTFTIGKDTTMLDLSKWQLTNYQAFDKIKTPPETNEVIKKMKDWLDNQTGNPKVLNMSELTPLAVTLGYELEAGTPLWYHLNVAMFDRELDMFKERIDDNYYDMVIFENIPDLNNFYPFEFREELLKKYDLWFTFQAPRDKTTETIEVFVKKR